MQIEEYTDKYYDDVLGLLKQYHADYLSGFELEYDPIATALTITRVSGSAVTKTYLYIEDGKCHGLLSGFESPAKTSKGRVFQEIAWHVDKEYGHMAFRFLERVKEIIKDQGFDMMVMGVLESDSSDRIRAIFNKAGYSLMESHYIRSL